MIAAFLILLLAASAEHPAPTVVDLSPEQKRNIGEYAACVARKHRAEAVEIVLNQGMPWLKGKVTPRRALLDCAPEEAMRRDPASLTPLQQDAFLFGLADALAREEFPTFDPNRITTAQPLPTTHIIDELWPLDACKKCKPDKLKQFEEARARTTAILAPQVFAECVVRTDPENAHKLVMADPASQDERSAFQSLGPAFGECVMQGSQFKADRTLLRGLVALSYYRIAHAPRVALTGAQK